MVEPLREPTLLNKVLCTEMCMVGGQRESLQSFIPLTCGGGRANVVDEVGRVAVTASEA